MKQMEISSTGLKLASPEEILNWSYGEPTKPETVNYRTGRPDREGLFSEVIFGPTKDFECACGKYKKNQFAKVTCDRCGVEVTHSSVRRERMGHITLATPIAHIWFLKVYPYSLSLFLDIPVQQIEKVVYYSAYIIMSVDEEAKKKILTNLERDYKEKIKKFENDEMKKEIDTTYRRIKEELKAIEVKRVISDVEFFNWSRKFPNLFEVGIGADAIRRFLEELDLNKLKRETETKLAKATNLAMRKRLSMKIKFIKAFIQHQRRPEWMILTIMPIIPPDLRPIVHLDGGKIASSDLNDLYRKVINRNNRLKKLHEIKAPEIIINNEKRMLQEAVDSLFDSSLKKVKGQSSDQRKVLKSLSDVLKGKQGRFRQNLLGKRVDYSGRSVIAVGPNMKVNECGLPKKIALEIFKPFIIYELLKLEIVHTVKQANYLIEIEDPDALTALEKVIQNKYVLLNRAPTLHRLGIQAFEISLVEGLAIRVPPLVCTAYNADFDGDQMAVFLPLSDEAQKEAKEILNAAKNHLRLGTGEAITNPTKDIVVGCYHLTQILSDQKNAVKKVYDTTEAKQLYEFGQIGLGENILVKSIKGQSNLETSVGRMIFNEALPSDYQFLNEKMDKKKLTWLVEDIYQKYNYEVLALVLNKIKNLGFAYATESGLSFAVSDLVVSKGKEKIIKEAFEKENEVKKSYQQGLLSLDEKKMLVVENWLKAIREINQILPKSLAEDSPPRLMIDSGARGSMAQLSQMIGIKGLVENPRGDIIELPVAKSYKEGLGSLEYFITTHGARKGASDTALKTARAGYLTRRMVDVTNDLIVREIDCGENEGLVITKTEAKETGDTFNNKIYSRIILETVKDQKGNIIISAGEYITRPIAEKLERAQVEKVRIRSPFTCKTLFGVCAKCYGLDLGYGKPIQLGETVGVIASESIGEPATQLTMRTFHVGGVAGTTDITQGVPRAEELLEVRTPKSESVLSPLSGKIRKIETLPKYYKLTVLGEKKQVAVAHVPRPFNLLVKEGEKVLKGQPLNDGSQDPKKIYLYKGRIEAFKYILNELKKVYNFQGAEVHDKHIEIIVRKMFARVKVKEPNDSDFIQDEIVEKDIFLITNRRLKTEGKKMAKGVLVLLGITKVALTANSFLSVASFQETSRALVKSALEFRQDPLRGLKENIIIGKKPLIGAYYRQSLKSEKIDSKSE
ncbi:MAG: DNA-directed RNA polymerase subunit beta' [Patescibacteria group bacterium]|nr:DNA-directed RNA polymerase subunit beta' [Patescibacteria group bacterium]